MSFFRFRLHTCMHIYTLILYTKTYSTKIITIIIHRLMRSLCMEILFWKLKNFNCLYFASLLGCMFACLPALKLLAESFSREREEKKNSTETIRLAKTFISSFSRATKHFHAPYLFSGNFSGIYL